MSEYDNLTSLALFDKSVSDLLTITVVEGTHGIVKHDWCP